jgi:capsular polysaccharide biosynthesis protein
MWLLNGIESAYSFVAAGQPGRYLCYAPEPWQKGLLKFVGVRDEKINQQLPWQTYLCEELAVHQYTHIDLIPNDMSKAVFGNIVSRCVKSPETPEFEKIFISRLSFTKKLGGNYRALLNEQELIAALQGRGYQIVEPQNLPFEDQVRIFNRAKIVVGLGGAGMFNAVFCKPKTKIVSIESTGTFALNHARLFWGLELQYGFIFGRDNREENRFPHNSWSIDVNKTINALVSFE